MDVNVAGGNLNRVPSFVRNLKRLECGEHDHAAVDLIPAQDGSVQYSLNECCADFAQRVREMIDAHNAARRRGAV